jgi:cyclopropane-fatty-acyl-phospholipid synthase
MLAARLISAFLKNGSMIIIDHRGKHHFCGPQGDDPVVIIRLTNANIARRLLLSPQLAAGEGFMRGEIVLEKGTLRDLLNLVFSNQQVANEITAATWVPFITVLRSLVAPFHQINSQLSARKNVAHHYDIGNDVYEKFLGETMQYSCAYFPDAVLQGKGDDALRYYLNNEEYDLDAAQRAKVAHIIAKLQVSDGMNVLDIGCGWGGTAIELAKLYNVKVTGISLSAPQLELARKRAFNAGVADRVSFRAQDYRQVAEQFDRVVSVGMFEHVGVKFFGTYFDAVSRCLKENGIALLHTIGRIDGPGGTNPWLRKYIFPGGYIPALSEIIAHSERHPLILSDVEVLRLHYAYTLREWHRRFTRAKEEIRQKMGDAFVRMWEFYLVSSEMAFVYGRFVNYQIQLAKNRFDLPMSRAYMYTHSPVERKLRTAPDARR